MNSRALALVLIIFGLLLSALLIPLADLAWMTLPFLAYLGLGILQAPPAEAIHLRAVRSLETHREPGNTSIGVSVAVSNHGNALNRLRLSDPLQPGMRLVEGQLQQAAALQPGEEAWLKYKFQSGRG